MSSGTFGPRPRWYVSILIALVTVVSLSAGGLRGGSNAHAAGAPAAIKVVPGWPGGITVYKGRYRLTNSGDPSFAKSGMLTVFTRVVPHQPKPQMSGILSLYADSGTNVLYLSHFTTTGTKLSANVTLGIYTGPEIGKFVVTMHQGAELVANFVPVLGGSTVKLQFTRFSKNPHP
ncbi:MAG: hypothetical protein JWO59_1711 [Chloroflexi bacterium]|nr:hypothetical protein [Chloroflexota bacterium]